VTGVSGGRKSSFCIKEHYDHQIDEGHSCVAYIAHELVINSTKKAHEVCAIPRTSPRVPKEEQEGTVDSGSRTAPVPRASRSAGGTLNHEDAASGSATRKIRKRVEKKNRRTLKETTGGINELGSGAAARQRAAGQGGSREESI